MVSYDFTVECSQKKGVHTYCFTHCNQIRNNSINIKYRRFLTLHEYYTSKLRTTHPYRTRFSHTKQYPLQINTTYIHLLSATIEND